MTQEQQQELTNNNNLTEKQFGVFTNYNVNISKFN